LPRSGYPGRLSGDATILRISLMVITRFGMVISGYTIVITPRAESR